MDYFNEPIPAKKLVDILNSIGLEVEGFEKYEEVKGNLAGLVTGEVISAIKHPNADKLTVTEVNTGQDKPLQIVCGAPNVAVGQKVIVAPVGVTIYPTNAEPLTMKAMKIRGTESQGMICADDEIGLGTDHSGIRVLDNSVAVGLPAASLFNPYEDHIIEIGLTPNRSDAMSHLGVARDICAYLNHHEGLDLSPIVKLNNSIQSLGKTCPISVSVENEHDCPRYTGILIEGVNIKPSPTWIQQRLKAIGQRSINNIVDITNYILHDCGQPLHAFDADKIKGKKIRVMNLPEGTSFTSLDEKERKLSAADLMICDADGTPMCIGGVFGGLESGVSDSTKNIFLESAFFNPVCIRKTSFKHQLRTDAAMHFEKSVDIGQTLDVLKKAANLICSNADGKIETDLVDVYPNPKQRAIVKLEYDYLKKLSGKNYKKETVLNILRGLQFTLLEKEEHYISLEAPSHKTDISIPADIVEEIMRIDGFDNIEIPRSINISPSVSGENKSNNLKEKISSILAGMGFNEMLNNSITHSAYYSEAEMEHAVKMLNNLSAELDTLRLSMLETGLQTVAHNLNHRNKDLKLFEFGKTYSRKGVSFKEEDHLAIFTSGLVNEGSWNNKGIPADLYYMKGVIQSLMNQSGISGVKLVETDHSNFEYLLEGKLDEQGLFRIGKPAEKTLRAFDIKVPVIFADIHWEKWILASQKKLLRFKEISRFPAVERDLAFLIDKNIRYSEIEKQLISLSLKQLKSFSLFDIFESEKLGKDKQSMAMNFVFQDDEKTLKDEEIDKMMNKITTAFESTLAIEIRK
jgi:phenylalanyl-tRNA synthetase beta chain